MATTNWGGNVTFRAARTHAPTDVGQLQEIVAKARRVKALGTAHSFNPVADTDGDHVRLAALPKRIELDEVTRTVRVSASVRFGDLAPVLDARGYALPNLGSLPHISVAGACATGTHGSGDGNGVLATSVRGLEVVGADGALRSVTGTELAAATIGLGAVGIVTELNLAVVDTYAIEQSVWTGLTRDRLIADLDEIMAAGYSVSVFTTWGDENRIWLKRLPSDQPMPARWLGTTPATTEQTIIAGADPRAATPQLATPGPWYQRLPHFRLEFTPSFGEEIQSEYFVPRAVAGAAIDAVSALRDTLAPILLVSEIRSVARDELWLSPAYGMDVVALHFTWNREPERVRAAVIEIERRLAPFAARPHWGKVFAADAPTMAARYPRLTEFAAYAREQDPHGRFANNFLTTYLP